MKISYILPITTLQGPRLISTHVGLDYLRDTLNSILRQSVPNWELIVISQKKYQRQVAKTLNQCVESLPAEFQSYAKKNTFLKLVTSKNLAKACNEGLALSKGNFVANIQLGDQIADHTTYEIIKAKVTIKELQFTYTDQDFLNHLGDRLNPFHKPDLSPDFLYCQNYIGSFGIFDRLMLKKLGGWNEKHEYAYDYELNLRVIEHLSKVKKSKSLVNDRLKIVHLAEVMYHQRIRKNHGQSKPIDIRPTQSIEKIQSDDGLRVVKRHLKEINTAVKVVQIRPKMYRHFWPIPKLEPLVSLIIPTRDGFGILKACVDSILQKTTYTNYEMLIVNNQSKDPKVLNYFKELTNNHSNIRVLSYNKPFNYSALNNYAVTKANGSIVGFINNDTEVITPDWLSIMVSHAVRPNIGAVGAMLYYPDGTIQHAGVKIDGKIVDNDFKCETNGKNDQKFNFLNSIRNPPAVTAAVLLVKKILFNKVRGFDSQRFKIEFNDVDLCLKLHEENKINIWLPHVELFHHESKTREYTKSNNTHDYLNIIRRIEEIEKSKTFTNSKFEITS
jgi:GT2 family glycosyltransferase